MGDVPARCRGRPAMEVTAMALLDAEIRFERQDAVGRGAKVDPIDEALRRSESTFRSPRMVEATDTSAVVGSVHWKPVKSLWISAMTLSGLTAPFFFTPAALCLFLATTAVTVCLGHSLGMHRR